MTEDAIKVVIVDDQAMLRAGFTLLLNSQPDIEVVGEAATGRDALAVAGRTTPDVVLMDVQMPDMDGIAATQALISGGSRARIVVFTTFERDDYIFEALRAGASGFLLKTAPPEELLDAVRVVASGRSLLDPTVTARVIERYVALAPIEPAPHVLDALTDREHEVLTQLARGRSNAEIATELFVTEATIKTHVSNLLMKLGLRDRVQAVVFAYEQGLVRPGN